MAARTLSFAPRALAEAAKIVEGEVTVVRVRHARQPLLRHGKRR